MMLALGLILLVVGAVVVYFGRPREQLLVYAGGAIFLAGVIVLILWLVAVADEEGVKTTMRLLGA